MRGCACPLPKRGPVSTGTSWGERSGAPAGERFPTFPHRGHPGGTVGTTTGRPQGLNPARMRGVEPAGRRKKNRRGGRSASAPVLAEYRTAIAGRPPPPLPSGKGELFERSIPRCLWHARTGALASTSVHSRESGNPGRTHRVARFAWMPGRSPAPTGSPVIAGAPTAGARGCATVDAILARAYRFWPKPTVADAAERS